MAQRKCTRCEERYRQSSLGLCRRCERETDTERPRVIAHRVESLKDNLTRVEDIDRPLRTVTVDGQEYMVVWDGTFKR
jgi:hypothetical protein